MSEEEVGQEFDRVARAAMMALGQVREAMSRRAAERDRQAQVQSAAAIREQEQRTAQLRQIVGRQDFWDNATGERVANAATYGATLYNVDRNAATIYDTVRDQAHARFGINVDEIRAQHPDSEEARRDALMHAVDDRLAAMRDDALGRDDRAAAADLQDEARAQREQGADDEREAGEATPESERHERSADRLDSEADVDLANEYGHEQDHDRHLNDAGVDDAAAARETSSMPEPVAEHEAPRAPATTAAGHAREALDSSYPQSAKRALASSARGRAPKAKSAKQQQARERTSGLSR